MVSLFSSRAGRRYGQRRAPEPSSVSPVLAGIESLTIFADDDVPGMKAARVCAERWTSAGREARISHPKELADAA